MFWKVLERIILIGYGTILSKHKILLDNQFGLCKHHLIEYPQTVLYNEISVAIDNYNVTVDTFLDLSKAFETADPNILLDKLFHYANLGVTGINLFNSTTPPLPSIL